MKNLITILILFVAFGCSKSPEEKVVGSYEAKIDGITEKLVLLENRKWEGYSNGEKTGEGAWKIVETKYVAGTSRRIDPLSWGMRNLVHIGSTVHKIEPNGDLIMIAEIEGGKREDVSKEDQIAWKKLKE